MNASKIFLITGGACFVGSAVIRDLINNSGHRVINLDKLTYAGNLESLAPVADSDRYQLIQADIVDAPSSPYSASKTVEWHLDNETWWRHLQDGSYRGESLRRLA